MEDPISRRLSLATWHRKNFFPNLEEFWKSGFYYEASPLEGNSDRLYCAFCPLSLKDWGRGDNPWVEHAKYGPSCIHLQSVKGRQWIRKHACSFRPTRQNIKKVQNNALLPLLGKSMQRKEQFLLVNEHGYESPNGVKLTFPDYRRMRKLRDRLATLTVGQRFTASKSREIASAGFYLTGEGLKCFYCSLLVPNFDVDGDPYELHAKSNPGCFYLVMERGEEFINHVRSARMNRNAVLEDYINTNAVGNLKNCGKCGQVLRVDECICCLKTSSVVCISEDCKSAPCCETA